MATGLAIASGVVSLVGGIRASRQQRKSSKIAADQQELALLEEQKAAQNAFFFSQLSANAERFTGRIAQVAADAEATFQEANSIILKQETIREGRSLLRDAERFRASQKVAFIKSGVDLSGSPILVLEETRQLAEEEVDALLDSGERARELGFLRAAQVRRGGRAQMLGSEISANANIFRARQNLDFVMSRQSGASATREIGRLNSQATFFNGLTGAFTSFTSAANRFSQKG